MITLQQFVDKYLGQSGIDFDGAWGKQCVDLFRAYHRDVLGASKQPRGVHGAKDFWTNYDTDLVLKQYYNKIPNTPDLIFEPGDVVVWKNNEFGHIAIRTNKKANTRNFESIDQNWLGKRQIAIIEHTYGYVYGVLRPKKSVDNIVDNSMMEIKKTEFTRLIDEANAKDTKISELSNDLDGEKSKTDEVRKELNTFIETLASKLTVIADKAEIIGAVERLLSQESEMTQKLVQAEKAYISLESEKKDEIGQLKKEINELRTTNERQSKMIEKLEERIDNLETPTQTKTFLEVIRDLFESWKAK